MEAAAAAAALLRFRRTFFHSLPKLLSFQNSIPHHNFQYSTHSGSLKTAINDLSKERDLDKLVDSFKLASASYRFRCRHNIYEFTVRRLAAAGRLDAVESIIEHQKSFSHDLAREGFGVRLITLYGKARMATHAVNTFHQLPSLGSPRSVMSFNAVLAALAAAGDHPRFAETFREVPAGDKSITPNLISYKILMKSLSDKGDLDAALDTLVLMKNNGIAPDLYSFNILLNGLYHSKRFSDADEILERMAKEGIKPDTRSFNAKMRGLVSMGKTSEAAAILDTIRQSGLKPDVFSFNELIKGYCEEGKLEQAKMVYRDLMKNGCAPNGGSFTALIPRLCEAGEFEFALELCKKCLKGRRTPGSEVLKVVADGLVKNSKGEEAKELLEMSRAIVDPGESIRMSLFDLSV